MTSLKDLYFHRELILAWTIRTIKARYQQSILGGLWAVIQPAAAAIIFSIIFTLFVPVNTGAIPYIVFSYAALVPWTLLSGAITDMVDSLIINMNLVGKIYFPREILPIAALLARLLDFVIASIILVLLILYFQIPIFFLGWLYLPIILATQLALTLGLGLIGSALNVFYRDVRHLFILGLQIWLYASPIIYPISSVPERFRGLYFLNPMAGIVEAYRAVLLYQKVPDSYLIVSIVTALVLFLIGYWSFKRVEAQFADVV
jgi:lipopolysaccharide transport system permease protein